MNTNHTNGNRGQQTKKSFVEIIDEPSIGELMAVEHEIVAEDAEDDGMDAVAEQFPLNRNMRLLGEHVSDSVAHGYADGLTHPTYIWNTDGLEDGELNESRFVLQEVARGCTSGNDVSTYAKVLGPCQQVAYLETVHAFSARAVTTVANRFRTGLRTSVKNHVFRLKDRELAQLMILGPSEMGGEFATGLERALRRVRPSLPEITFRASEIDRVLVTGLVEIKAQTLLASAPHLKVPAFSEWWPRAKAFNLKYHRMKRMTKSPQGGP